MNTCERVDRITKEISGVAAQYGVTSWELTFLESVRKHECLTAKQESVLARIEKKVFEEDTE